MFVCGHQNKTSQSFAFPSPCFFKLSVFGLILKGHFAIPNSKWKQKLGETENDSTLLQTSLNRVHELEATSKMAHVVEELFG